MRLKVTFYIEEAEAERLKDYPKADDDLQHSLK